MEEQGDRERHTEEEGDRERHIGRERQVDMRKEEVRKKERGGQGEGETIKVKRGRFSHLKFNLSF